MMITDKISGFNSLFMNRKYHNQLLNDFGLVRVDDENPQSPPCNKRISKRCCDDSDEQTYIKVFAKSFLFDYLICSCIAKTSSILHTQTYLKIF